MVLDPHVLALDEACFVETLTERIGTARKRRPTVANPITGIAGCCARATTGHAAALPSPAINSRRRIGYPPSRFIGSLSWPGMQGNGYRRTTGRPKQVR
jgi:hypothetical protein